MDSLESEPVRGLKPKLTETPFLFDTLLSLRSCNTSDTFGVPGFSGVHTLPVQEDRSRMETIASRLPG